LDVKEREAIYYFYYEKLTYEQIAIILEFTHVSSARRLIYRALGKLRKYILLLILGLMVEVASK
jgi:DNA-directed RNA polymerase specialized sigma24 family protein